MKPLIAVLVCKALYFIGKLIGRGSSLPGQAALRVCPDALKRLELPETIIAVTGSNGKTTTVEMIAHVLETAGMKIGCNREGSNQTEGIATLLLRTATLGGRVKRDALVLECDERYARKIFENVRPSVLLVTNLCRDQLTRNGHPEFIQDCIRSAIEACQKKDGTETTTTLVLNADDPYVASLAASNASEIPTSWFGIKRGATTPDAQPRRKQEPSEKKDNPAHTAASPIYDDGAFCPECKGRMSYEYRITAHLGGYRCAECGHTRPKPAFEVTGFDYDTGLVTLNKIVTSLMHTDLAGVYNLAAAIAAAAAVGINPSISASALDRYELKGGRTVRFTLGGRKGILLVSKHENSLAYNQTLEWAIGQQKPCTVIILVDAISRKYYTSETSWLWDINFDILADECVQNIILAGRYHNELAARFAMTPVKPSKISLVPDWSGLRTHTIRNTTGEIYAVTCFSDKRKISKTFKSPA